MYPKAFFRFTRDENLPYPISSSDSACDEHSNGTFVELKAIFGTALAEIELRQS